MPSEGFEPSPQAPKACTLSITLRGLVFILAKRIEKNKKNE